MNNIASPPTIGNAARSRTIQAKTTSAIVGASRYCKILLKKVYLNQEDQLEYPRLQLWNKFETRQMEYSLTKCR